jgi:hypothetical protein
MSLLEADVGREVDDEAVVESIRPPTGVAALAPAAGVGRGPVSGLDRRGRRRRFQHHKFLESARMDRELAREAHGGLQPGSLKSALSINRALLNMSNQRFVVLAIGVLLLVVGLAALRFPTSLPDFDQWGFQINCGSGFQGNLTQATVADSRGTRFTDQCHAAIATRRAWAVPLAAAGAVLLSGLLLIPPRQHSTNFE